MCHTFARELSAPSVNFEVFGDNATTQKVIESAMRSHHFLTSCGQFARSLRNTKCAIWMGHIIGDVFDEDAKTFGGRIHTIGCLPDFLEQVRQYLRFSG